MYSDLMMQRWISISHTQKLFTALKLVELSQILHIRQQGKRTTIILCIKIHSWLHYGAKIVQREKNIKESAFALEVYQPVLMSSSLFDGLIMNIYYSVFYVYVMFASVSLLCRGH